jgi:RNA polymerase sigma-70 factor (ECF subfamily)
MYLFELLLLFDLNTFWTQRKHKRHLKSVGSIIEREKLEIEQAKKDPRMFEPLYLRYYNRLYGFVFKRINDEEIAADIVSQTFLKALNHLHKYEFRGLPFSAWLYRMAINLCQDYYREKKKTQTFYLQQDRADELIIELEDGNEDGLTSLKLSMALKELKPKDLNLIELRFFEKLSFAEIGEIVQLTEAAAKMKVYRILKKMKELIESDETTIEDII